MRIARSFQTTSSGHDLTGITLVDFCLGEPEACMHPFDIDPSPDMNRIVRNRFEGNKTDVIYIPGNGTLRHRCAASSRQVRRADRSRASLPSSATTAQVMSPALCAASR